MKDLRLSKKKLRTELSADLQAYHNGTLRTYSRVEMDKMALTDIATLKKQSKSTKTTLHAKQQITTI